jgi:serine/threonine-protein kinase
MIGHTVSHYKITARIGSGGMGTVYKAEDTRLKRNVALKFLPENLSFDLEAKTRFMHEAQAASALDHPNICNIHEIDQTMDGQFFLCMTLYEGDNLKKKIQDKRLSTTEVINIAFQIGRGLARAHEAGIVHRDLKPANIMFTKHEEVKIVDFGLAKLSDQTDITKEGTPIGTIAYMSPEQAQGESVDMRTDIWSFGVILYEMLCRERPFKGDYEQAVIYSILNEKPASLEKVGDIIPSELKQIVNGCLQKNPNARFNSMHEIVKILEKLHTENKSRHAKRKTTYFPPRSKLAVFGKYILVLIALLCAFVLIDYGTEIFDTQAKYLAILPFTVQSTNKPIDMYCAGLIDIMTSKLTQTETLQGNLWIIPSSEIRRYNITSAGRALTELNASIVITGSLNDRDEYIQLTLNLIDTKTLRQLASRDERIPFEKLPELTTLMFKHIVDMLEMEIQPVIQAGILSAVTQSPDAHDYYLSGRGYLSHYEEARNIDTAISLFLQALTHDTTFVLAHAGLGEAYWRKYMATKKTKYVDLAKACCQKALKYAEPTSEVFITCGMIKNGIGQYEEAEKNLKQALKNNPVNATAFWELGKAYLRQGKKESALATFKQAVSLRPSYWQGYSHIGYFYLTSGQYALAIEPYKKIIEILPHSHIGYENLAAAYFYLDRLPEAVYYGEKSVERGKSYKGYNNLATYYYYDGQFEKAVAMYRQVLTYGVDDFRLYGNLANGLYYTNHKDSARYYYEKAIALANNALRVNPANPEIESSLAGYLVKLNQKKAAANALARVLELKILNIDIYFDIGDVYEQLGERDLAIYWLGKALENGFTLAKIKNNPGLAELRNDHKFKKLLKKLNIE